MGYKFMPIQEGYKETEGGEVVKLETSAADQAHAKSQDVAFEEVEVGGEKIKVREGERLVRLESGGLGEVEKELDRVGARIGPTYGYGSVDYEGALSAAREGRVEDMLKVQFPYYIETTTYSWMKRTVSSRYVKFDRDGRVAPDFQDEFEKSGKEGSPLGKEYVPIDNRTKAILVREIDPNAPIETFETPLKEGSGVFETVLVNTTGTREKIRLVSKREILGNERAEKRREGGEAMVKGLNDFQRLLRSQLEQMTKSGEDPSLIQEFLGRTGEMIDIAAGMTEKPLKLVERLASEFGLKKWFMSYRRKGIEGVVTNFRRALQRGGGLAFQDTGATTRGGETLRGGAIPGGAEWEEVLQQSMKDSDGGFFFLTRELVGDGEEGFKNVANEVLDASRDGKEIVPLAMDPSGEIRAGLESIARNTSDDDTRKAAEVLMGRNWIAVDRSAAESDPKTALQKTLTETLLNLRREREREHTPSVSG